MAPRTHSQSGASLLVTLGALILLAVSAVAILRSVDTSTLLAGNLAFRQSAVVSTDYGVEAARNFVRSLGAAELANPANASKPVAATAAYPYWSVWQANFNPETYDWDNQSAELPAAVQGNSIRYVIHRMCEFNTFGAAGDLGTFLNPSNNCIRVVSSSGCVNSIQTAAYGQANFQCAALGGVYYRVTVRARGPRGTTSYIQVMLH